jgi:predicted phage-related endonuclease
MKFHIEQGTDNWLNLRSGKFTASSIKNLFAKETTAAYQNEIYRVVFERLTGKRVESEYQSAYMKRGQELEPHARTRYELITFNKVDNGGFFEMTEWAGASPDGLIGEDGILEVKSPAFGTMIKYLIEKKLPNEYYYQVHSQLLITGRQWCDFVAFHPDLETLVIRVNADKAVMAEINKKIKESILKVKETLKLLK